jgi:hypothetical protein
MTCNGHLIFFPTSKLSFRQKDRSPQHQYSKPNSDNSDNLRGMSPTGSPARLGAENNGLDTEAASHSDGQSESIREHPPWVKCLLYARHAMKATLYCSYANLLLFCVPLGIIAGALGWNPAAIFTLNFLAIFPLAALLSYSTDELSAHVGQTFGGFINATFGNAVEMIVSSPCIVPLSCLWLTCVPVDLRSASLP